MWDGSESVSDVADWAAHLPRGGAVGEWYGGALAITAETEAMWELTFTVAQVNSKKKLKPRAMPKGLRDVQASEKRKAAVQSKKARALADMKKFYG